MSLFKTCLFATRGKKIRQLCKNYKLRIIVPIWNDEFEVPGSYYSVTYIQDYIE